MDNVFDVVFRGDVRPDATIDGVRAHLKALFRLDDDQVARLFTGRPHSLRKNLDRDAAEKFSLLMAKAGAVVELRPSRPNLSAVGEARPVTADRPADRSDNTGNVEVAGARPLDASLAPVGADVLRPEEKPRIEAVSVTTDHLSVDVPGADVLRPDERRKFRDLDIDTSHLKLSGQ